MFGMTILTITTQSLRGNDKHIVARAIICLRKATKYFRVNILAFVGRIITSADSAILRNNQQSLINTTHSVFCGLYFIDMQARNSYTCLP